MRKQWTMVAAVALFSTGAMADAPKKAPMKKAAEQVEKTAKKAEDPQAAMMEAMQKLATPDEHHKLLTARAGKWKVDTTMWMEPGKPPMKTTGETEIKSILGGRFITEYSTGTMMGQPFEGFGILGYDKMREKYTWDWQDTMGTYSLFALGTADASGKVITYEADEPNWESGGKGTHKVKFVTTIVDDNHFTFAGYEPAGGKDIKVMEIAYTRK